MITLVRMSRTIPAPREAVFDAWLSPEGLGRFLCPAPGVKTVEVSVDARIGGAFSLVMVAGEARIPIHGVYRVLQRPHHLEFTWLSGRTTSDSTVSLTFEPEGEHTQLTLEHTGFVDASSRDDHDSGWDHILGRLGQPVGSSGRPMWPMPG